MKRRFKVKLVRGDTLIDVTGDTLGGTANFVTIKDENGKIMFMAPTEHVDYVMDDTPGSEAG